MDATDQQRRVATVQVLAPGQTLPPAYLQKMTLIDATRGIIKWSWSYPQLEDVIGFRVYFEGKIVADEKRLSKDATEWTFEPTTELTKQHRYAIEAVGASGAVSERFKTRFYTFRTRFDEMQRK